MSKSQLSPDVLGIGICIEACPAAHLTVAVSFNFLHSSAIGIDSSRLTTKL
jgi:hypothetical protein